MSSCLASPRCGEVWQVSLDPVVGHEQGGTRPVVVVSGDAFNQRPHGLCVTAPLTTRIRDIPTHVPVQPPEGGLSAPSVIMCDQTRTISLGRLVYRRGAISRSTLSSVKQVLQRVFDI